MSAVVAVIPVRLGSKRFPQKALTLISGKPLIYHVWREAVKSRFPCTVIIATDSKKIADIAADFGAETIMTAADLCNGTERVASVAAKIKAPYYINIQGDNYRFSHLWLERGLKDLRARKKFDFHTLFTTIRSEIEYKNMNTVKLVAVSDKGGWEAKWFTRGTLPAFSIVNHRFKHIGIYFYRRAGLLRYRGWDRGIYEDAESLEQLRILENNERIGLTLVRGKSISIDSPKDIANL